jgi:XapX domain-containing protein
MPQLHQSPLAIIPIEIICWTDTTRATNVATVSYLQMLAVGLLVGAVYAVLRTRSPAPPPIALVGLAGMLVADGLLTSAFPTW